MDSSLTLDSSLREVRWFLDSAQYLTDNQLSHRHVWPDFRLRAVALDLTILFCNLQSTSHQCTEVVQPGWVQDTSQSLREVNGDGDDDYEVQLPATTLVRPFVCVKWRERTPTGVQHADKKLHTWLRSATLHDFLCWMTWRCDLWRHRPMSKSREKATIVSRSVFFLFNSWKKQYFLHVCSILVLILHVFHFNYYLPSEV